MSLKNKIKLRTAKNVIIINRIAFIALFVISSMGLLIRLNIFDMDYFVCKDYKSIQFNLLTVNSILLGFLFTFLGIFITASESESLKENRAYSKFGVMVWSIVVGLIAVALSLLISIITIIIRYEIFFKYSTVIISVEISFLMIGVGLFLSTTFDSIFLMKMIRKRHKKYSQSQVNDFKKSISNKK